MKKCIYLIVLPLLLAACNKAKQTTLNGQVRTFGTETAIHHPPVKVQILEKYIPGTMLSGPSYDVIAETWTDQDGYFTISHALYKDRDYYLGVEYGSVIKSHHYIQPNKKDKPRHLITERGGTFTKNYYLSAYGWVNFHFVSTNPQPGDVYGYNLGGGASEIFYNSVDEYRTWDFGGNVEHEIALNKFTNTNWINWQIPFFVPALDTISLEIEF